MADFVQVGPHIVSKGDISHITKHIDSVNGSKIIVCFHYGKELSVRFDSLSELALTFNSLIKNLT